MLKKTLAKARELVRKIRQWVPPDDSPFYQVRYTSVPVWRLWRDY
jgi:hypothetical protein